MNKPIISIIFAVMIPLAVAGQAASQEIDIIVNGSNNIKTLSKNELRQIFLGKIRVWPSGDEIEIATNVEEEGRLKEFTRLIESTVLKFSRDWVRISLSGDAPPPVEVDSDDEMINFVSRKKGAIGFIGRAVSSDKVRIVEVK